MIKVTKCRTLSFITNVPLPSLKERKLPRRYLVFVTDEKKVPYGGAIMIATVMATAMSTAKEKAMGTATAMAKV
jgi:hypothetical protein